MLRIPRLAIAPIAALVLASCAIFGDPMPSRVVDDTFRQQSIRFYNSAGTPETGTYYLKIFKQDGMIAVCGVWVQLGKGTMDQLIALWFDEASIFLQKRTNKIVRARFIEQSPESDKTRRATCVKSATPATPELLNARAGFDGLEVFYQ